MKAVFIDANILLDLIDKNRTRHLKSKEVLKKLLLDEYRLGISEDMFSNIYYVQSKRENGFGLDQRLKKLGWRHMLRVRVVPVCCGLASWPDNR